MTLPNCYYCGRFVGYKKPYTSWIYFGNANSLEPPDECVAHAICFNQHKTPNNKSIYWQGPITHIPGDN